MLKVEGKVLFKGKEERSSLGFKDAVEAYPFLSGLVTLLSLERPAWEDVGPLEERPSYAAQIMQAGLVRDLRGLMAASTSRVYEVGGERAVVIPLGDYQGLIELRIQEDQYLANLAGL